MNPGNNEQKNRIVSQSEALDVYLEDLLGEVEERAQLAEKQVKAETHKPAPPPRPEPVAAPVEPVTNAKAATVVDLPKQETAVKEPDTALMPQTLTPPAVAEPEPVVGPKVEVVVKAPPVVETEVVPEVETATAPPQAAPEAPEPVRPSWAEAPFQSLVFEVMGLKLAVALAELNGITKGGEHVSPVPHQPTWYMGLMEYRGSQAGIIDTGQVVMPERSMRRDPNDPETFRNILFICDGRFGLVCDQIGEVITLDPQDVRWRTSKGKRPWLAGTVIKEMCALLDVYEFAKLIDKA